MSSQRWGRRRLWSWHEMTAMQKGRYQDPAMAIYGDTRSATLKSSTTGVLQDSQVEVALGSSLQAPAMQHPSSKPRQVTKPCQEFPRIQVHFQITSLRSPLTASVGRRYRRSRCEHHDTARQARTARIEPESRSTCTGSEQVPNGASHTKHA